MMDKVEIPIQVNIPVEDVVEYLKKDGTLVQVVRCGKCNLRYKPLDDDVRNETFCTFFGSTVRKDNFCSYGCADDDFYSADGERKTE